MVLLASICTLTTFAQAQENDSKRHTEINNQIVVKWLDNFWGANYNPDIIDELAAPDMILQYSLHKPRKGQADIKDFMKTFRDAFPDLSLKGAYPLLADGEFVIARWIGGGTHTGKAFSDWPIGSLPAATGRKMYFSGTTVFRVVNGKLAEEIGLDDGLTALTQLKLVVPGK
ncbi:MAG: ester cyclase [Chitinophagaceae bacterium]|nr:ester cyclase [Chitinophagaceae bacterium]